MITPIAENGFPLINQLGKKIVANSITEELYKLLLRAVLESQNNPVTVARNYQSLKAQIIQQELQEELNALSALLEQGIEVFRQGFLDRCKSRAEQNTGSCLSLFVMPDGQCNQLYWRIAELLFKPKTMQEMLGLLAPNITTLVTHEATLETTQGPLRERLKSLVFHFEEGDLTPLDQPPSRAALGDFAASGNLLFDITNLERFNFPTHEKFFNAFQEQYPKLAAVLYQHNEVFKTLHKNLLVVSNKGQTPREVIEDFIQQLFLGGETLTGETFASLGAQAAVTDFFCYLSTLSTPFKEELLLLEDENVSLDDICEHLRAGECIETAAKQLKGILNNKSNETTLDTRPHVSPEELLKIQRQYGRSRALAVFPDGAITTLPTHHLEKSLNKLVIENDDDYVNLLLSFPSNYYTLLFKHAQILCEPPLSEELAMMIEEDFFNSEQLASLIPAIFINIERLGGLSAGLEFAMKSNNYGLLELILSSIPLEARLKTLQTLRSHDNKSILQYAARVIPLEFYVILEFLPPDHRKTALLITTASFLSPSLHSMWKNSEALERTLSLLPEEERLAALLAGGTLTYALFYPAILQTAVPLLPQAERLEALTGKILDGRNFIEQINSNEIFAEILTLIPETVVPTRDTYSSRKNEKILMLYDNIKQLKSRGLELFNEADESSQSEGRKAICIALSLGNLAHRFLNARTDDERNIAQQAFEKEMQQGMEQMQHVSWIPFFANIVIAATGLGLLAIAVKKYLTGSSFFMETERHQKANEIASNFAALQVEEPSLVSAPA